MLLLLLFIIVIESLLFPILIICVLFDWSVSLSQTKVGTVGCTLWLALSKQMKILFFLWQQYYSHPTQHPPPPPTSPYWNCGSILSLVYILFSFVSNSLSQITIPKNLSTLATTNLGCWFWRLSIFNVPPLPNCQQPQ